MKEFKAPVVETIYFDRQDIISSSCGCVGCEDPCPSGKFNCQCVDFTFANQ